MPTGPFCLCFLCLRALSFMPAGSHLSYQRALARVVDLFIGYIDCLAHDMLSCSILNIAWHLDHQNRFLTTDKIYFYHEWKNDSKSESLYEWKNDCKKLEREWNKTHEGKNGNKTIREKWQWSKRYRVKNGNETRLIKKKQQWNKSQVQGKIGMKQMPVYEIRW